MNTLFKKKTMSVIVPNHLETVFMCVATISGGHYEWFHLKGNGTLLPGSSPFSHSIKLNHKQNTTITDP